MDTIQDGSTGVSDYVVPPQEKFGGMMKEYEAGRDEIRSTESAILQVLSIMLGASAVVIGQGITNRMPWVFLIPMILMTITVFYVADKRWVIWMLATYQRAWIEGQNPGVRWERTLAAFRDGGKKTRDASGKKRASVFVPASNIMWVEFLLFFAMGFVCIFLFWEFEAPLHPRLWVYLVPGATVLFLWVTAIWQYLVLSNEGRADSPLFEQFKTALSRLEASKDKATRNGSTSEPGFKAGPTPNPVRRRIKAFLVITPVILIAVLTIVCLAPHQSVGTKNAARAADLLLAGALMSGTVVYLFMHKERKSGIALAIWKNRRRSAVGRRSDARPAAKARTPRRR